MSRTLQLPGTAVETERSSSLGLLDVVRSDVVPFRQAPGLSLNAPLEPAEQRGIFVDGEGPVPLTRFSGDPAPLAYLDITTAALPYHLLDRPAALLLGAGGGSDVLTALVGRAASVDVVELDPGLVRLVRRDYRAYAGGLYDRPDVRVHVAEARRFLAGSPDRYDLIQLPLLDALGGAGRTGLHETYLYTVEAFLDALDHLTPRGMLSVGRWLSLPPRDVLKALLTAIVALERRGAREPGRHLLILRSWDTVVLLARRTPFAEPELAAARAFAAGRGFDLDYDPGAPTAVAGRFNTLAGSSLHDDALALLGPGRAAFVAGYKFDLRPATDDRPYFFDFVRWRALPELLAVGRRGDAALVDWGHLVQLAGLALAVPLSLLLVLLPLRLGLPRPGGRGGPGAALFFVLVGAGFMAVEIATIQRLILFLGHPAHAVAASLAAFLGFAGLGGRVAARLDEHPATAAAARAWPAPALGGGPGRPPRRRVRVCAAGRVASARAARGADQDRCRRRHRGAPGRRHGRAVPAGARAGQGHGPAAGAVGLGRERLRLGGGGAAGHAACRPPRAGGPDPSRRSGLPRRQHREHLVPRRGAGIAGRLTQASLADLADPGPAAGPFSGWARSDPPRTVANMEPATSRQSASLATKGALPLRIASPRPTVSGSTRNMKKRAVASLPGRTRRPRPAGELCERDSAMRAHM